MKKRPPQSFEIPSNNGSAKSPKLSDRKGERTEHNKTSRKPKAIKKQAVITMTSDEAAQLDRPPLIDDISELKYLDSTRPLPASSFQFRWSKVMLVSLIGLISLAFGVWLEQLISGLFAKYDWLGWVAVAVTGLFILSILVIVIREILAIRQMTKVSQLQQNARTAIESNDTAIAKQLWVELLNLYRNRPDTARGRAELDRNTDEVIDGQDMILLAENSLMKPLDGQARTMIMKSAKRVSVVTAVSPKALIDVGYVIYENAKLLRAIAVLYGGRPGTFGFFKLSRSVLAHLAVTGTLAIGEGLVQQVVGQGLAARISSRLGEGVVNGLLTARIGLAAMDVCRPVPFSPGSRPGISDFLSELTRFSTPKDAEPESAKMK